VQRHTEKEGVVQRHAEEERVVQRHAEGRPRWKLRLIRWRIRRALLVVEEHVHVLDAVLKLAYTPLDLIEEKLLLKTARYLQRDRTVICSNPLVYKQLREDA
jgi:hypothetical protein